MNRSSNSIFILTLGAIIQKLSIVLDFDPNNFGTFKRIEIEFGYFTKSLKYNIKILLTLNIYNPKINIYKLIILPTTINFDIKNGLRKNHCI